jgi:uncharacterized linocin/CFP29 family protein
MFSKGVQIGRRSPPQIVWAGGFYPPIPPSSPIGQDLQSVAFPPAPRGFTASLSLEFIQMPTARRRVVDFPAPGGIALPGVATGHLLSISAPAEGIVANQREVKPLVELRVPFDLSRQAIDDVERGSDDSDWQPAKDAGKKLAFAEDRAIFKGYSEAAIQGISEGTSNPINALPADVRDYPDAVAQALSQLRLVGVNGPYSVLLGADEYTVLAETRDHGYPVLEHVKRIVDGNIVWAPALEGALVLTTRGGDFELNVGQDVSIGYLSHTESVVRLYLQETFTFRVLTGEAAAVLSPSSKSS